MQGIELKCRKSGRKYENAGNQGGNVRNQNRNLGIAVEMTQNSNGNSRSKAWREAKIIENEHICKNFASHI